MLRRKKNIKVFMYMKKKIFSLLALVCMTLTASADVPTYSLTKASGAEAQGTITFKVGTNTVTAAAEGATVTMTIAPNAGWVVNTDKVEGKWTAAEAKAPGRRTTIDLLQDIDLGNGSTDQTTGAVTYSFTMERATAVISAAYKKLMTNDDITIDPIDDVTYNGQPQTPTVTVKDGSAVLVEGTDYTVAYSNNTSGGTATVTINGIGDKYSGTTTTTFTINAAPGSVWFYPSKYEKTFGDEDFTVKPTTTGDGSLFYWSKNEDVATVDSKTGLVHIVGTGIAYINATIGATGNYTTASDYYVLTVNPKEVDYDSGDVTQDEDGYTVTMTEDENKPNADPLPDDADLSNLTYDRDLTAPGNEQGGDGSGDITIDEQPANMYTVCLPFAPKKDAAVKYYTLSSVVGETLVFDEVADAQSHTPYLVAVFGDVNVREDCSDLDVSSMTINSMTVDGYTFNGTFTGKKNADALGLYILQRNMQWGKVTSGNVYIPPFRAFVEAPASSAPLLNGTIGDGSATGIKNIRTVDLNGTERWYDLSGRRMVTPAKGIGIKNGKKVVVK